MGVGGSNHREKSEMKRILWTVGASLVAGVALVALSAGISPAQDEPAGKESADVRCFELRIYTAHPGKLDALHARFRDHTNRLFQKHGMELIGYWTPLEGDKADNTLVYILAYPSREAREQSWKAFGSDPEWQQAYQASHKDGPLVDKVESTLLTPTDYSALR
jgi:hypothetical protein